jgi:hypothetical protein
MSAAQGDSTVEQTPDKKRLMTWREGVRPDAGSHKANELVLPDGRRP